MPLINRVRQFAARHRMWREDTRIIAAVSGGSDSTAMLLLLHELHGRGELHLAAVAHLNHSIRDVAGLDEQFCSALAGQLGVPFLCRTTDVPALAAEKKQSLEMAGRAARRQFFEELSRQRHAHVATGHTQDDQAETVLLRVLRGAGSRGLAGIVPRRGNRIRPVLCATREELRAELRKREQPWRDDETNEDLTNPRNRVRHELLPYIRRHFNPAARRALAGLADTSGSDDAWLTRQAAAAAVHTVQPDGTAVRVDRAALRVLPEPIAHRVVRYALAAAGETAPGLGAVRAVMDVASGRRAAAEVPRVRVEPFGDFVVLVRGAAARPPVPFRFVLDVPGALQIGGAGWIVEAERPSEPEPLVTHRADTAQIDAATVGNRLIVRSREPGDRVRVWGTGGRKKLQDVFVDRKVSRTARDIVPIVTHTDGRIVWVAGHVVGEEFRVTGRTKAVIILKLRRV